MVKQIQTSVNYVKQNVKIYVYKMFIKCVEVQEFKKRFYNISFKIIHRDFILQTTHKFPESFCRNN